MGDYLRKVSSNTPLSISAQTWNLLMDMARDYLASKQSFGRNPLSSAPQNTILVKNNSGSDVTRFGILGIDNVVITPTDNANEFKSKQALLGAAPSTTNHASGKFVICAEPIANGKIGRAYVSGACVVKVNVTDESHSFADVADGDIAKLASAESGPCAILWKESGTGEKWAIVRFGGSGGGGLTISWGTVIEAPTYGDPENFTLPNGRGYYTIRPLGVTYEEWDTTTEFVTGDKVYEINSEGAQIVYTARRGDGPSGTDHNINKLPSDNSDPEDETRWWDYEEEVRIEHALGADGKDIRLFIPWYEPGAVVPYLSRQVSEAARYYIWLGMTYAGIDELASLRWNQTDQRAMACYK
jgi:hypothetical protein